MQMPSRDVVVLAAGQALTSTVVSLLTSVSSLSGAHLAPAPALATVPVTASVLGTLAMMYPAHAVPAPTAQATPARSRWALPIAPPSSTTPASASAA